MITNAEKPINRNGNPAHCYGRATQIHNSPIRRNAIVFLCFLLIKTTFSNIFYGEWSLMARWKAKVFDLNHVAIIGLC